MKPSIIPYQLFFVTLALLLTQTAIAQKLAMKDAPAVPELLGENFISTVLNERDFALSPDGNEIFYTLQSQVNVFQTVLYSKKDKGGNWSKPELAPFAGQYTDLEPAFSADGRRLYFASNRPVSGSTPKDFDIWMVERKNGGWGEPVNLGAPVNTPADEFYPSIAKNGNLYFTATYKHGRGREDIWMAKWEGGKYSEPTVLDSAVNGTTYEFNAFVSPDEDFIIFTSYGRKDDKGRGDLYMSVRDESGKWLPAKHLTSINSDKLDYCPFVSFDKRILFFTSERHALKRSYAPGEVKAGDLIKLFSSAQNGGGNIYWVGFEKILKEYGH